MWTRVVAGIAIVLVAVLAFSERACAQRAESADDQLVLPGRVTRIIDGDTVDVQLGSGPIRVRMQGIDAPERDQPKTDESVALLRRLLGEGEVELLPAEQTSYNRMVARIYVNGADVNAQMVRRGLAMAERRYLNEFDDGADYCVFEHAARTERLGIWPLPADQRIAPWEWRRGKGRAGFTDYSRETVAGCVDAIGKPLGAPRPNSQVPSRPPSPLPSPPSAQWSCAVRKTCPQMQSCEESQFHLRQCRAPLDKDGDGVPCEAICR
jgi:endonuclease YncB( thermonuclease family)